MLGKEEESNLLFPHFPFGQNNDLQPENHGEIESTHIYHSHFHKPRAGRCEAPGCHLWGQKHSPTSIMVQSLQPPSTLPSAQRCHPHWRKETCLAQKVGFSPPSQAGNCFGFLAWAAEKKATPQSGINDSHRPTQTASCCHFISFIT